MKICEITDAQGQLELLRTIIDTTWSSIAQQAEQEKQAEAARKAQAKLKPRGKKRGKGAKVHIPSTPPPPKKPIKIQKELCIPPTTIFENIKKKKRR